MHLAIHLLSRLEHQTENAVHLPSRLQQTPRCVAVITTGENEGFEVCFQVNGCRVAYLTTVLE